MNVTSWTDERISELKDLWVSGHSAGQIGKLWGVTRNTIMGKISRLGLESPVEKLSIVANGRPRKPNSRPRKPTVRRVAEGRKLRIRRTLSPHYFVPETGELIEIVHELLGPPVSLMDLEHHHCRWAFNGEDGKFWYCGVQKVDGCSYCPTHRRMVYIKPPILTDAERAKRARWARKVYAAMATRGA